MTKAWHSHPRDSYLVPEDRFARGTPVIRIFILSPERILFRCSSASSGRPTTTHFAKAPASPVRVSLGLISLQSAWPWRRSGQPRSAGRPDPVLGGRSGGHEPCRWILRRGNEPRRAAVRAGPSGASPRGRAHPARRWPVCAHQLGTVRVPLLDAAGFAAEVYEEPPDWQRHQRALVEGIIAAEMELADEFGMAAAARYLAMARGAGALNP